LTALLIDLTIVGIVVFCAWRGYRNGLIRGVFGVVTLLASLLFASIAATAYSDEFTGMLTPFVGGVVDTALSEIASENGEYEAVQHEDQSEDFKAAYTALRRIGLPVPAAIRIAELAVGLESEGTLADKIAEKLSSILAYVALFGISFILIAIIFAVIGNLISFVFSLPGLRALDVIAGVIFGFVKGLLIVLALATVVRYFGLLALETLEKTSMLNYLVNNNIIADMLGI